MIELRVSDPRLRGLDCYWGQCEHLQVPPLQEDQLHHLSGEPYHRQSLSHHHHHHHHHQAVHDGMDCKQYQQYMLADSQDENSKKTREWIEVGKHHHQKNQNWDLDYAKSILIITQIENSSFAGPCPKGRSTELSKLSGDNLVNIHI